MGALGGFALERIKSLVSKKVGAAVMAEGAVATANPDFVGVPLMVFIAFQALTDIAKYYVDRRWPKA